MRLIPWRSKTPNSSRSVAATPARRLRVRSSFASDSGRLSNARRRLSAAESKSLAKPATAYFDASSRSRCARRRTFSVSASARSNRSLYSASSASSSVARVSGDDSSASDSMGASARPSILLLAAWSLAGTFSCFLVVVSSMFVLSYKSPDHLGGVVHHRDDAGIVDPSRADDADRSDDLLAAVLVGGDHHRAACHPEKAIFSTDEYLDAFALFAGVEQTQHGFSSFEHLEKSAQPFEI